MKFVMNTLINWLDFAVRSAVGLLLLALFCCVVGTAAAWALIMGRPSPFGDEEDTH